VVFRDGGNCANQAISQLVVRNGSEVVYTCSNGMEFGGPCNSSSRFRVIQGSGPDCPASNCKYFIDLELLNFTESDAGTYEVDVQFESVGGVQERNISRTFFLQVAASPPTGNLITTMYFRILHTFNSADSCQLS
jgi:hypothetical protein